MPALPLSPRCFQTGLPRYVRYPQVGFVVYLVIRSRARKSHLLSLCKRGKHRVCAFSVRYSGRESLVDPTAGEDRSQEIEYALQREGIGLGEGEKETERKREEGA